MALRLEGWAGDSHTPVKGRKPLQVLLAVSGSLDETGSDLADLVAAVAAESNHQGDAFKVSPVVPGRATALLTRLAFAETSNMLEADIQIAEFGDPWPAGVNLVHVFAASAASKLPDDRMWRSSTFATVIVPAATETKSGSITKKGPKPKGPLNPSGRGT